MQDDTCAPSGRGPSCASSTSSTERLAASARVTFCLRSACPPPTHPPPPPTPSAAVSSALLHNPSSCCAPGRFHTSARHRGLRPKERDQGLVWSPAAHLLDSAHPDMSAALAALCRSAAGRSQRLDVKK